MNSSDSISKNAKAAGKVTQSVAEAISRSGISGVLATLSGGADSTALLLALADAGLQRLVAIHCNFHLRGEESDRDMEFCKSLCESLGIKLITVDFDVEDYRRRHKVSVEMACRELRYAKFREVAEAEGLQRIAVAHNADDNIETLLLNLLRGGGIGGLKGMDYDNGEIIRPLLNTSRKEIIEFLASRNRLFITDSSNLSSDYRRNFLRNDILPLLRSRWEGLDTSLLRSIEIFRKEDRLLKKLIGNAIASDRENFLPRKAVEQYGDEASVIFFHFLSRHTSPASASNIALEMADTLPLPYKGRRWNFPEGNAVVEERDGWVVTNTSSDDASSDDALYMDWKEVEMSPEVMKQIRSDRSNRFFYTPLPPANYELRKIRQGDRIHPIGMKGSRLVSDVISDAKLSTLQKSGVRVLERKSDGKIVWVTDLCRSREDLLSGTEPSAFRLEVKEIQ